MDKTKRNGMKTGNIELVLNKYKEYHTDRYDFYLSGNLYDIDRIDELNSNERGASFCI